MYKNWRYLKEREGLNINPFIYGIFGIFFYNHLLHKIHKDRECNLLQIPDFRPNVTATIWVVLSIFSYAMFFIPGYYSALPLLTWWMMSSFLSYLCFVPVQKYTNSIVKQQKPEQSFYKLSKGESVCLVVGICFWILSITFRVNYYGYY
jgi:hypothetical protein